jgi:hypothetical protein
MPSLSHLYQLEVRKYPNSLMYWGKETFVSLS